MSVKNPVKGCCESITGRLLDVAIIVCNGMVSYLVNRPATERWHIDVSHAGVYVLVVYCIRL